MLIYIWDTRESRGVRDLRASDAPDFQLPAYAWPGGYPLFYLDSESNVLCPDCANRNAESYAPIRGVDVNWEDGALFCDECSQRIESAYADDDDDTDGEDA